ncbi:hypothetical protein [Succinimonas amylolytica]|uniref:hypothetical protein n=1 Tax=Succinimonas amylolytica TaxID=83769 RepID=UPI000382489D|nr:hypothetical protein [Succinimonas amylolytica]
MFQDIRLFLMASLFATMAVSAADGDVASSDQVPQKETEEKNTGENLNRPLEEALQDVEAITQFQNTPENLEQNSNDILKLNSVVLDKKGLSVIYTFQFKISTGTNEMQQFIKDVTSDFQVMDCLNTNFAHAKIGNTYIIRDVSGKEVVNIESRYDKCPDVSLYNDEPK